MRRRDDWPERLAEVIAAADRTAFDWPTHNCVLFAANAVRAMTDIDLGAPARGLKTRRGALGRLKRLHDGSLEAAVTSVLGLPLERVALARRGDVAIGAVVDETGVAGEAVGVVLGARVAFATPAGLGTLPLRACRIAWRV